MSGPPGWRAEHPDFFDWRVARRLQRQNHQVPSIPMTRRWVATRDSAKQAAAAFLKLTLRRPQWWVFVAVVEALFAVVVGVSFDEHVGLVTRVVLGLAYAVVPTLVIAGVALGVGYFLNRRRFDQRLGEGVLLESGFGERFLVLRGPWAETTLSFDGIAALRPSAGWVFLQQKGSPVLNGWPAELFSSADLARLERRLETRNG
jgi:hypothetical protein